MTHGSRRSLLAFTLVEMLVALGVLVVAMAVVTNIFGISAKTAAQAQAIGQIESALDSFVRQMRADLEGIDPSRSVLVLQGRSQAAARTEELRQAGQFWRVLTGSPNTAGLAYDPRFDTTRAAYPPGNSPRDQYSDPRADVLAFYTHRPLESRAPATETNVGNLTAFQASLQRSAKSAPAQIVYGIGSYTDVTPNAGGFNWNPNERHIGYTGNTYRISQFPLTEWMLTRRQTLIDDNSVGVVNNGVPSTPIPVFGGNLVNWNRIMRNYAEIPNDARLLAADSMIFAFRDWLDFFGPVSGNQIPPLGVPYRAGDRHTVLLNQQVRANLYPDPQAADFYHVTTLAQNAPPDLQSNQALIALPACAWFQVEFLMPEDPRNSVQTPLSSQRDDLPRWVEVPPGQTYAFAPDSDVNRRLIESQIIPGGQNVGRPIVNSRLSTFGLVIPTQYWTPTFVAAANRATNRAVRLWPYAIRITVRAFDREGKLNEPIVRTIVHRFE